ncbi:serine/threonine protein kinase [Dietzia sp. DQ11-38-2]|uniref:serine/threonine protein kinase n=1 Tax=Dietzia sp. DQ11-38-2 TaxID=2711155 RepID=UPI0015FD1978|nr:serine/threonine protein kinase [Dietzia sp. DQ11-38-2]MBB1026364.1 serine/threonine protein kinase [Dietzia sp. DQ11-38-2]
MNQNPPPQWSDYPTSEFGRIPQASPVATNQKQSMSPAMAVMITLMAVLIVGLIAVVAFLMIPRFTSTTTAPVTSTVSATATASSVGEPDRPQVQPAQPAAPSGSFVCSNVGGGPLAHSAVGSSVTSCEFAVSVRSTYLASGGNGGPMTIDAYSPVTGATYTMSCSGGPVVTCTGGNNAVVYIY